MAKSAKKIEQSAMDELNRLADERGPIAEWLEGLEERRGKVSETIFRRVRADYTKRIADLDRLAKPLRVEASKTIASLDEQIAQLETSKREVEFDLQELELRHSLDELTKSEFEERAKAPRVRIEELTGELEETQAERELWIAARGEVSAASETPEVTAPPPAKKPDSSTSVVDVAPTPPAASPSPTATASASGASPVEITMPHPIPPPRASSPEVAVPPPANPAHAAARTAHVSTSAPPPAPAVPTSVAAPPPDRTVVISPMAPMAASPAPPDASKPAPAASLIPVDPDSGPIRGYALAAENSIGRVPENSIQVNHGSVSRRHAILRATADGWSLEDLGAENGTWVNGERIEKRTVADGDRVNIGTVRFLFRIG